MVNIDEYMTIAQAGKLLGVTTNTLRNWEKMGKIKSIRHPMNNRRTFKRMDIYAVLEHMDKLTKE
jgi:DNA-binding transcriptional MerR regulator